MERVHDEARGQTGRNDRRASAEMLPALLAGANLALGLWLLLSPVLLGYERTGTGNRSFYNDLAVGGVLMITGILRLAMPLLLAWVALVGVALGAWLLAAPWVLDHGGGPNDPAATVNDLALGALVILSSAAALVAALRGRRSLVA